MFRIMLMLIGLGLTLGGSVYSSSKDISVEDVISAPPGTYRIVGLFASEENRTLISDGTYTITGWNCDYCEGYGIAVVDKRGGDYTIRAFEPNNKLIEVGEVIERKGDTAKINVRGHILWVEIEIVEKTNYVYLIDEKWVNK